MFMTLVVWICALPLLAIFVLPFLGWVTTGFLAALLLILSLIVCWVLCAPHVYKKEEKE